MQSTYLLNAKYIVRNARLDEAQAGIKTAGRNINNLRYADDANLMAESEKELKSLLMKVKEEGEKVGLKLNIQNPKIMASGSIISWQIDGETNGNSERLSIFALLTMPNWNILKEMGIPDHLTCLLRNLYAGQEATVKSGHGKMDCF